MHTPREHVAVGHLGDVGEGILVRGLILVATFWQPVYIDSIPVVTGARPEIASECQGYLTSRSHRIPSFQVRAWQASQRSGGKKNVPGDPWIGFTLGDPPHPTKYIFRGIMSACYLEA